MRFPSWRPVRTLQGLIKRAGRAPGGAATRRDRFDASDYALVAAAIKDVILLVGPDGRIRYASPSATDLFGWTPAELVGRPPDDLVLEQDLPVLMEAMSRKLAGDTSKGTEEVRIRRKDGRVVWTEGHAGVRHDPAAGTLTDIVVVIRDITDRKRLEAELSRMALVDGLTGLENRRAFDNALAAQHEALENGSELSLLVLDLDHFKALNDRYGHQVGDDCLRTVAVAVRLAVRPGDTAARYGGEEIAVVMPGAGAAAAAEAAERLRAAIEDLRLPHEGNPEGGFQVTASIGAATALARSGAGRKLPDALIAAADRALYRAKAEGRNRVATELLLADCKDADAA